MEGLILSGNVASLSHPHTYGAADLKDYSAVFGNEYGTNECRRPRACMKSQPANISRCRPVWPWL